MPIRGYEEELESERGYVAGLYAQLDTERTDARTRYTEALRDRGNTLVDRDVAVHTLAREVRRLNVAEGGLCFGRLDAVTGERSYIGRIGLFDQDNGYEPLLLDWRAPAARVLCRDRRQAGGHATAPSILLTRAGGRRVHRRDPRQARWARTRQPGAIRRFSQR